MREALAPFEGQRIVVRAAFRRFDVAPLDWGGRGRSRGILLVGVTTPAGDLLADHMWLSPSRTLTRLKLQGGAAVELRVVVVRYRRADGSEDFKIADVRSARRLDIPPPAEVDLLTALRARASVSALAASRVGDLLTHVQRATYRGARPGAGNWYASLLEARGAMWQLQQAMGEVQSLIDRMGTRPAGEVAP